MEAFENIGIFSGVVGEEVRASEEWHFMIDAYSKGTARGWAGVSPEGVNDEFKN